MNYSKSKETLKLLEGTAFLAELAEKKHLRLEGEDRERLKGIFSLLLEYFKYLLLKERPLLHQRAMQEGIYALMHLVSEVVQKEGGSLEEGDKLSDKISAVKEYQDLTEFYLGKMTTHFGADHAAEEWDILAEEDYTSLNQKGLESIQIVRNDTDYELFFLRSADGRPLFTKNLLHHLKLLGAIDASFDLQEEESFFHKILLFHDRQCHMSAQNIMQAVRPHIDTFYLEVKKGKVPEGILALNHALMALLLAGNPRNLLGNTTGKSSLSYFHDFDLYLRKVLLSSEYQSFLKLPANKVTPFIHAFLSIVHLCVEGFWMGTFSHRELITFLQQEILKKEGGDLASQLFVHDEELRRFLMRFPNQPLKNAASLFKKKKALLGFNSLDMFNFPLHLYTVVGDQLHLSLLKMGSPTEQSSVAEAHIMAEFKGFLDLLSKEKIARSHLLFNLQEGTSWKDHARVSVLETLSKEEERLIVVSLPKSGDFYQQRGDFENQNRADAFLETCYAQIVGGKGSGYFFSNKDPKEWSSEIQSLLKKIHTGFFDGKETLSHGERLDFIELFHLFFSVQLIAFYLPDSCSFTCKDGIDHGAMMSGELFALLKLSEKKTLGKEEYRFLFSLLYAQSLEVRGRAPLKFAFQRMLGAVAHLEKCQNLKDFLPGSFSVQT